MVGQSGLSISELPDDSVGQGGFSPANCIRICCAARNSTAQPCGRSLNNFIRLGFGPVLWRRSDDTEARHSQGEQATARTVPKLALTSQQ